MNEDLAKRNKLIFNMYINQTLDMDYIKQEYQLTQRTIKLIIKNYVKASTNKQEIIKYNQVRVMEQTKMTSKELKGIYELFVKHNWNIDFDNYELEKYDLNIEFLEAYAKLYHIFFVKVASDVIYDDLKLPYRENDDLNKARTIIKIFIKEKMNDYNLNKYVFYEQKHISAAFFYKCIRIIKEQDKVLFSQYEKVTQLSKEEFASKEKEKIFNLIKNLENGVEDQDIIRNYDAIDFYIDFNKDVNSVSSIVQELYRQKIISLPQLRLVKDYIHKLGYNQFGIKKNRSIHPEFNQQEIDDILNSYKEFNCQRDTNGFPIKGTGIIISREDNQAILDFLDDNDIIKNIITYNAGVKRLVLGIKIINHNKKLTK